MLTNRAAWTGSPSRTNIPGPHAPPYPNPLSWVDMVVLMASPVPGFVVSGEFMPEEQKAPCFSPAAFCVLTCRRPRTDLWSAG